MQFMGGSSFIALGSKIEISKSTVLGTLIFVNLVVNIQNQEPTNDSLVLEGHYCQSCRAYKSFPMILMKLSTLTPSPQATLSMNLKKVMQSALERIRQPGQISPRPSIAALRKLCWRSAGRLS